MAAKRHHEKEKQSSGEKNEKRNKQGGIVKYRKNKHISENNGVTTAWRSESGGVAASASEIMASGVAYGRITSSGISSGSSKRRKRSSIA